jgi:ribosomal-protein-alanine N-acetyltransferase
MILTQFCRLSEADLDAIVRIEEQVYSHPWTRGNFHDSLQSGYEIYGLRAEDGRVLAYLVFMLVLDEIHILNFAVSADMQGQGMALQLLQHLQHEANERKMLSILLEVRVSNARALHVYRRYGFAEIGRRKGYYPLNEQTREDAIVMRMEL